jgi:hypothetical protein
MFNKFLKDKRKLFIGIVCAFIAIAGLNYLYKSTITNEGLTTDVDTAGVDNSSENVIEVVIADKPKSDPSEILPVQSPSSVGPLSAGEPVMSDVIVERFTGGDSTPNITTYGF